MATSFVTFDNRDTSINAPGFWVHDSLLEIISFFLVKEIDCRSDSDNNYKWMKPEYRNHLFNNASGMFSGFMHLSFSEFINTNKKKEQFIIILNDAKKSIQKKGQQLSVEDLNSCMLNKKNQGEWYEPLATDRLIKVLNWIDLLLNKKLTVTAATDVRTYFF